jgi:hypothetical protein
MGARRDQSPDGGRGEGGAHTHQSQTHTRTRDTRHPTAPNLIYTTHATPTSCSFMASRCLPTVLRHLLCHSYASRLGGFGKQKNAKNEWEKVVRGDWSLDRSAAVEPPASPPSTVASQPASQPPRPASVLTASLALCACNRHFSLQAGSTPYLPTSTCLPGGFCKLHADFHRQIQLAVGSAHFTHLIDEHRRRRRVAGSILSTSFYQSQQQN